MDSRRQDHVAWKALLAGASAAGFLAAGAWLLFVACPSPEEDGCSSIGSAVAYWFVIGVVATVVLTIFLGAVAAVWSVVTKRAR